MALWSEGLRNIRWKFEQKTELTDQEDKNGERYDVIEKYN